MNEIAKNIILSFSSNMFNLDFPPSEGNVSTLLRDICCEHQELWNTKKKKKEEKSQASDI